MENNANIDTSVPVGEYIPPSSAEGLNNRIPQDTKDIDNDDEVLLPCNYKKNGIHHQGYVRIIDAKGKSFPCGFSRHVGCVMENVPICKKRSRSEQDMKTNCNTSTPITSDATTANTKQQKRTITEERIHPEEALFLYLRGLLRIESSNISISNGEEVESKEESSSGSTKVLSTKYLFEKMLLECNISLAAYLAYAHLRQQGYILIRYSDERIKLLCALDSISNKMQQLQPNYSATLNDTSIQFDEADTKEVNSETSNLKSMPNEEDKMEIGGDVSMTSSSRERYLSRPLRSRLSDDIANAPPPCVVSLSTDNVSTSAQRSGKIPNEIQLAYYAYKPNAQFRRSNPGLPDFGVAIMPFHSDESTHEPTFDTLASLVSMCESSSDEEKEGEDTDSNRRSFPLQVVTVADGGACMAFGITHGDVPSI